MASTEMSERVPEAPRPKLKVVESRTEYESDTDDEMSFEMLLESIETKKAKRRQLVPQVPLDSTAYSYPYSVDRHTPSLVDGSDGNSNLQNMTVNTGHHATAAKTRQIPIHLDPYMAASQDDEDGWTTITSDEVAEALADNTHANPTPPPTRNPAAGVQSTTTREVVGTSVIRRMIRHINNGISVEEVARRYRVRGRPSNLVEDIARFAAQRDADAPNAGV
ncbi:hypothetical protein PV08_03374 [Exophiala spinifera]|uniref:Uncharacterized protein n=1 Tax=Exophiala spinifera TaxID=91928 RepID=A0A0D2A2D3_9EURO|nr:uncharacterized protein PV08_03374 [Exophiala spinifera]KIW19082.1 hypothetical protein PV08_03374 [Exophiala spinifera]